MSWAANFAGLPGAGTLLLVCILRGGVMFLTDLMRSIDIPHAIEFMAVSSYGVGGRESTGQVRITLDLNIDITDWDVLLVEDIIDSGLTLASVLDLLAVRKPRSLRVCTLLDKFERREVDIPVEYVGFRIPNKFVFGYGLDIDDYYRDLPFVGVVDLEKYQKLTGGGRIEGRSMKWAVDDILAAVAGRTAASKQPVYLVGGAVRDRVLGKPIHDLDFVMTSPTLPLAKRLADELGGGLYVMDAERDITRVVLMDGEERLVLDFSALRGPDLEADLRARDYTINAMAMDVRPPQAVIDPCGGLADLREKRLRACGPTSLSDDPARVLRGVRLALSLSARIEPQTQAWMRAAAPLLPRVLDGAPAG